MLQGDRLRGKGVLGDGGFMISNLPEKSLGPPGVGGRGKLRLPSLIFLKPPWVLDVHEQKGGYGPDLRRDLLAVGESSGGGG